MNASFLERGGLWVIGQSILMVAVLALGPMRSGATPPVWLGALAGLAFVLGAGFGLAGAWVLGRNRTVFPKPNAGSQLIQHGAYRLVRHPLYTSLTLLALGWAAWWTSWPTFAAAAALVVFLVAKSSREERWLRAQFPDYADYARRVCRLIPWVF